MSAEIRHEIRDDGAVAFAPSGHVYRVRRFARGAPAVTLVDSSGAILASDRFEPIDARARARFAAADAIVDASVVLAELIVLAELLADDGGEPAGRDDDDAGGIPYAATPAGLVWKKPLAGGAVDVPLTNFTAAIVGDVVKDDGMETIRAFELEVILDGRTRRFAIAADRFAGMGWVTAELGANALLYPGPAVRDHARAAIQLLSPTVAERRVFTHLGWREVDGAPVYLHAGGAMGVDGGVAGIAVEAPDALHRFALPAPVTGAELVAAIRASLGMLAVMPDPVTVPLYGAIWRAVIGEADFSLHATGPSGEGKSEVAALAQQYWGAGLDARHLPGSWSSTGNALEGLAFAAKDALVVIDDFVPTGTQYDAAKLHREADRILRAQGNRSSRLRMRATASGVHLQTPKPPRGLILSTGEDIPRGQSLRGRLFILDVGRGQTDWARLSRCQRDAAAGLYARAFVGFVGFFAHHRSQRLDHFKQAVEEYRATAYRAGGHRRTPEIVANLAAALDVFAAYAVAAGAMSEHEATVFRARCWRALGAAAAAQPGHQAASEPTWQFRTYLASAISSGEAHVADVQGGPPAGASAWGWRLVTVGTGDFAREEWRPQGKRVGWLDQTPHLHDLYLDGEAAFAVAQDLARRVGDGITVTSAVFRKRLKERGLLAATDKARETLTVRKVVEGGQKAVLHVVPDLLDPGVPEKPDKPDSEGEEAEKGRDEEGAVSGGSSPPDTAPDGENAHRQAGFWGDVGNVGFSRHTTAQAANAASSMSGGANNPTADPTPSPTPSGRCLGCGEPLPPNRTLYCAGCERLIWGGTRR